MYLEISSSIIVFILAVLLFIKRRKESTFSHMRNVKTGELMNGMSFYESLYDFLFVRRKVGFGGGMRQRNQKYGSVFRSSLVGPSVTFADPNLIRQILRKLEDFPKQTNRFARTKQSAKFFGTVSLLHVNQPEWHDHRALLNKAFTSNKIFFEPMQRKATLCIQSWKNDEKVNIGTNLQKMTLDVLATCIFGMDFDTLNGNNAGPLAAYNYCLEELVHPIRILFPWYSKLPLYSNYKLDKKVTEFDDYCWSIIQKAKSSSASRIAESSDKQPISLIDLMVDSGMTDAQVRDNVGIFFLAGHETTSSTLSWITAMLASNPDVQQKARQEVLQIAPNGLTYESLKDLEYIDWIIHETMRMYPAVPGLTRTIEKDMELLDWTIPANTTIQLDFISNLYSTEIWGDPQNFRPERWDPNTVTKEQRTAWMPFSYGPRICIGMNFSLVEQKIFISTLLREFSDIKLSKGSVVGVDPKHFLNAPDYSKFSIEFVPAK